MKAIIVTVLMLASLTSLQAQVGAALTLACNGATSDEMSEDAKREPISMGIIVNFTTRTVQGFGAPGLLDYPVKVTGVDDVTVVFSGSRTIGGVSMSINGTIDRITGDVQASETSINTKTSNYVSATNYVLKCRPTQRMF
jgi:hypothetical protein